MVEIITGLPSNFPSILEGVESANYVRGIQIGSSPEDTGRLNGQIEALSAALTEVATHPELLKDATPTLLAVAPKPLTEQEIAASTQENLARVLKTDATPGPFSLMTYHVPKAGEMLYARPSSALPKAVELANSRHEQAAQSSEVTQLIGRTAVHDQSVDLAA
jgi:hypothetical protein